MFTLMLILSLSQLYLHIFFFFFFNDTATTEIYTLSLHDALPISGLPGRALREPDAARAAIVLERVFRQGVGDPFAVRGELRIAHGLQRDEVVERDGALLGVETGKGEKGKGKRERQDRD